MVKFLARIATKVSVRDGLCLLEWNSSHKALWLEKRCHWSQLHVSELRYRGVASEVVDHDSIGHTSQIIVNGWVPLRPATIPKNSDWDAKHYLLFITTFHPSLKGFEASCSSQCILRNTFLWLCWCETTEYYCTRAVLAYGFRNNFVNRPIPDATGVACVLDFNQVLIMPISGFLVRPVVISGGWFSFAELVN